VGDSIEDIKIYSSAFIARFGFFVFELVDTGFQVKVFQIASNIRLSDLQR
jgi:hypothetical protein